MIQVDIPGAFTIGHVLALLAKKYLKKEPDKFTHKLMGPLNFYLACGFSVAGLYLLIGWPSWEAMYVTGIFENPYDNSLTTAYYILFMISMIVVGNFGFILAHKWYLQGKDRRVVYGALIGGALALLPFLIRLGIYWRIGTYAEIIDPTQGNPFWQPFIFWARDVLIKDGGYSFFDFSRQFFWGWLCIMSYLIIFTVFMGRWFKKKGNELS